jgi:hypothetical protein
MVNLAEMAPAGTVTLKGTGSAGAELDRVTTAPAAGAGPVRVTLLFVDAFPETIKAGETTTDDTEGGTTVTVAVLETPP